MNKTTALIKKELHTAKWFLMGGIIFFWSFPLLEGIGTYYRSGVCCTSMPSAMAITFGAIFGIIVASGMVCLEMPKGLYEFWCSRPVKLLPYMTVKYVVGLAVTLFVITVPVLFGVYLHGKFVYMSTASYEWCVLYVHTFIIILVYSITFCAGHIFRNMTETVIISCAGLLLVYIVPVLVPALEALSFFNLLMNYNMTDVQNRAQLFFYIIRKSWIFLAAASVLSAILIVGTWICLKRHVQLRLGLKSLCWSLGLVALFLFSAAAFSIGSNLNCLAKSTLLAGKGEIPLLAYCFDDGDVVILRGQHNRNPAIQEYDRIQIDRIHEDPAYQYRCQTYMLEKSLTMLSFMGREIAWSKQTPDIIYFLGQVDSEAAMRKFSLYVIKLDDSTHTARLLSELPVGEYGERELTYYSDDLVLDHQTLYLLLPSEVVIFDVKSDNQPRLLTRSTYQACYQGRVGEITIPLPIDKALSEEQRYRIAQYVACRFGDWEGDRYVRRDKDFICVYEVNEVRPEKIRLVKIAERKSLPLEKLMEYNHPRKMILREDMVYSLSFNDSLSVYQLNESSGTLKKIGHYAASEGRFYDMFLRDDGNIALVGTSQLHIVQPPVTDRNK